MGKYKDFFEEIDVYEKREPTNFTIQDALVALGVYAVGIDPDECQTDVDLIAGLAQQQQEFIEISEDREVTEKRIYHFVNEMQDPVHAQQIVSHAIRVLQSNMKQRACEWLERICYKSGLTEAKMKKLNEIEAKLR